MVLGAVIDAGVPADAIRAALASLGLPIVLEVERARPAPPADQLARLQARFFELLPGEPVITRDNLDSMKVDNVVRPSTNNKVLTTAALGIKLTALEAVAPQYLAPPGGLDVLRARAGR